MQDHNISKNILLLYHYFVSIWRVCFLHGLQIKIGLFSMFIDMKMSHNLKKFCMWQI